MCAGHRLRRDAQDAVGAIDLLHVRDDGVGEQVVQRIAEQLSRRGRRHRPGAPAPHALATGGTHAHHQQTVRAQVQRRTQRRVLAHGAVAEILVADTFGRKDQRHGHAGHQVRQCQLGATPDVLGAHPFGDVRARLEVRHRSRGGVAGGAQAQRVQVPTVDAVGALHPRARFASAGARSGVLSNNERGTGSSHPPVSSDGDPAQAGAQHLAPSHVIDLLYVEVGPDLFDVGYRRMPLVGSCRQHAGSDRATGSAEDYAKRIGLPGQQFGRRLEHAHLVGRTGTAAGQYQCRNCWG